MWKSFHIQIITPPYSYSFLPSCLANSRQSSNLVSFIRCFCLVMTQLSTLALLLLMPSGNCHKTGSQNKYCILFMGFPSGESCSPDCMISLPQNSISFVQSYWKENVQCPEQKFFHRYFITRANKWDESLSLLWQNWKISHHLQL